MNAVDRRNQVLELLKKNVEPFNASAIAAHFHVSRQLIVGDIALLRAAGAEISATPRGYIYQRPPVTVWPTRTIACRHHSEEMAEELYTIVDFGCAILDVIVEHPVYGQIVGQLQLFSRFDVSEFLQKIKEHQALPLSKLTDGVHLHTMQYQSEKSLQRVLEALAEKGILFEAS